jgi:serine/threonine protein kinase
MQGGKKYGEGVWGETYDFACKYEDNQTFCDFLKEKAIQAIHLHSFEKVIILTKENEIKKFIKHVSNMSCCVAKIFKNYMIGLNKNSFHDERRSMKIIYDIFKDDTEKETTLTSLRLFGFNFIGAHVIFEDNSNIYSTFTKRCDNTLNNIEFTNRLYKRLIKNVLNSFVKMQENNFSHCDIKPDNIIYCKKDRRFKLIDWGLANHIKRGNRLSGSTLYSCPLSHYMYNVPGIIAVRLMYYKCWKTEPEWFNSEMFQDLYKMITEEYHEVVKERGDLLKKYGKKFDIFNLGMTLCHLVFKNGLNWKKYRPFIVRLVSMKGHMSAIEALREIENKH